MRKKREENNEKIWDKITVEIMREKDKWDRRERKKNSKTGWHRKIINHSKINE